MKWASIVIALLIVFCDQILNVVANKSRLSGSIGGVHFTRLHNYGATMGILRGDRAFLVAIGLAVVAVLATIWFNPKTRLPWFWGGWALLMGGTVGNLLDRATHGYVTDMLQIPVYPAIFNVADIAIRVGMIMMLFGYLRQVRQTSLKGVRISRARRSLHHR